MNFSCMQLDLYHNQCTSALRISVGINNSSSYMYCFAFGLCKKPIIIKKEDELNVVRRAKVG